MLNEGLTTLSGGFDGVFQESGLEEITLPSTLKKTGSGGFFHCNNLKMIYVEDGCEVDLHNFWAPHSAKVCPPPETIIGGVRVWDLRKLKDVIIPNGTERIGNHWFWGADIEKITIPASVLEIGTDAFCECKKLREVIFEEGSRLEKIGQSCFYSARIRKIVIPRGVEEI